MWGKFLLDDFPVFGEHVSLARCPRYTTLRSLRICRLQTEGVDVEVRLAHLGLLIGSLESDKDTDSVPTLTTDSFTVLQGFKCFSKVIGLRFLRCNSCLFAV